MTARRPHEPRELLLTRRDPPLLAGAICIVGIAAFVRGAMLLGHDLTHLSQLRAQNPHPGLSLLTDFTLLLLGYVYIAQARSRNPVVLSVITIELIILETWVKVGPPWG